MRNAVRTLVNLVMLWVLAACGAGGGGGPAADGVHGGPDAGADVPEAGAGEVLEPDGGAATGDAVTCPPGQLETTPGVCTPVGIQGCAAVFVDADGVCRPAADRCEAGTIPQFAAGCVPVGVSGCVPAFVDADGLCRPSMARCAGEPGTIPKLDAGCVAVGVAACDPQWVGDGVCRPSADACADGTFPAPDGGCVPLDGPEGCGAAPWGNVPDGADTLYVHPDDGDDEAEGTRAEPLKTIAEAVRRLMGGGRVVLAGGTYDEPVRLRNGLSVIGRCASLVTVTGVIPTSSLGYPVVVYAAGSQDAAVEGLTIAGAGVGVGAGGAADVRVERVRIRGARRFGVLANGAGGTTTLRDVLVEDTASPVTDDGPAAGIAAYGGASVTLTSGALTGNVMAGALAGGAGSHVGLERCLVAGTRPRDPADPLAIGVGAAGVASLAVEGCVVTGNATHGVFVGGDEEALDARSEAAVRHSVVADNGCDGAGGGGGLTVGGRAALTVTDSVVDRNCDVGVAAFGADTTLTVERSLVARSDPGRGASSQGCLVGIGATATFTDAAFVANVGAGAAVGHAGSRLTLTRVLVEGSAPGTGELEPGSGVSAFEGATLALTDVAVLANHYGGVLAASGATLTATSILVEGTLHSDPDGIDGMGVSVDSGAVATLTGAAVLRNRLFALNALGPDTDVMVSASLVGETLAGEAGLVADLGGSALVVADGARVRLDDSTVVHNRGVAVVVGDPGTELVAQRSLIEATLPQVAGDWFGHGLGVRTGARAELTGCALRGNRAYGAIVSGEPSAVEDPGTAPYPTFLVLTDCLVADTLPELATDRRGLGVVAQTSADLTIERSLIEVNRVAAVLVYDATARVTGTVLRGTVSAPFSDRDELANVTAGDGLLAVAGADVDVLDSAALGCARAGFLFSASGGSLSGCAARANEVGLVVVDDATPEWTPEGNRFEANRSTNVAVEGDFGVPAEPMPLPGELGGGAEGQE